MGGTVHFSYSVVVVRGCSVGGLFTPGTVATGWPGQIWVTVARVLFARVAVAHETLYSRCLVPYRES
jgi:hypothetical protein